MYKQPTAEPIAIVGSSCRFAGSSTSPSKLWEVLSQAPDLSREVPRNRFSAEAFYHPDGEYQGTTNSVRAYWLEQDHRVFDAGFFSITPKEAEAIDPQQRLSLEVVYEALEAAGYTLQQCAGRNIGVYSGVMTADYDTLQQRDEITASQYYATGNARSIISNRISYFFDFHGPSMTIDTACSSSLVALHQAVLSLRAGESSMACVTGVNMMITPEQFIVESSLHMLSPTGKSRMWDADADGYARGEGVAAILLKPLSAALADGDTISGVVRETGVNQDGRTKGITMPNPAAQARLIRETYQRAGLDARDGADQCQYFEAHGTGTHAGDPREAAAIHDAFFGGGGDSDDNNTITKPETETTATSISSSTSSSSSSRKKKKMLVGSVKTVIGHTEGAAGLAGLLKVVQAMRHGAVPPNLHLERLNPAVAPFYAHLEIPTALVPWPETGAGQPRRASVNSFGFGGTNAHAIIELYTPSIHKAVAHRFSGVVTIPTWSSSSNSSSSSSSPCQRDLELVPALDEAVEHGFSLPLLLSAASQKSLPLVAATWRDYLAHHPDVSVNQLAWNLFSRRTALSYRVSLNPSSRSHALELLSSLADRSAEHRDIGTRSKSSDNKPRVIGVFTGQGAQWPSMSRCLFRANDVYRQTIRTLDQHLKNCPDPPLWTLEEQVLADKSESRVHEGAVSQPLTTAVQIGLVDLLGSLDVGFHAVIGHSSGEIAAAYAAGRLTARDAILISYYRGLYAHLAAGFDGDKGGMLAVGLPEKEALGFCRQHVFDGRICVAASNSPTLVTLSGDLDMIHLAREKLTEKKVFARLLVVDTAYHSPHMTRPAVQYVQALQRCDISPLAEGSGVVWVSSVYGHTRYDKTDLRDEYWKDNMVHAVQFHDAVESALSEHGPFDCAVEIGPHPALKGPFTETAKSILGNGIPYSGVLSRSRDDNLAVSDFLGFIWSHFGLQAVDLRRYAEQSPTPTFIHHPLTDLPSYPWDHSQIHYREGRISHQYHFKTAAPHELLGVRTRDDNAFELRWRNNLKLEMLPWIEHHRFQGQALVPASAYCVMALDAARVLVGDKRSASVVEIRRLDIASGISIDSDSSGTEVLFALTVLPQSRRARMQGVIEASFTLTSCPAYGSTVMKKNMSGNLRIFLGEAASDALPSRPEEVAETLPASPAAFYKMMDDTGLVYSGPFRSIQSIQRRHNYSSTTVRRFHPDDSTSLSVSPATLDSCLQSAFLAYASPGDKALWTSFLPATIENVRFNLAACTTRPASSSRNEILTVDSHMMNVSGSTPDSKATFTVDISISNERGETEIQVQGLSVSAIADTRPEDDYELYLHTVMDLDPTDEIVGSPRDMPTRLDPMLVESCERVSTFFRRTRGEESVLDMAKLAEAPNESWLPDTKESIDKLISTSPYHASLDFIRSLGSILPDLLPGTLPFVMEEANHHAHFNRHVGRIVKQIAHRFPRMNVLGFTTPESGLTEHILAGLGDSFLSYTVGSDMEPSQQQVGQQHIHGLPGRESIRKKIHTSVVDLDKDIHGQTVPGYPFDLVILSTSFLTSGRASDILKNVRASMRDGGFLILTNISRTPLKDRLRRIAEDVLSDVVEPLTPPDWPDVLDVCGFLQTAQNSNQYYSPGLAISVRQASCETLKSLSLPTSIPNRRLTDEVLIIGGAKLETERLSQGLHDDLGSFTSWISWESRLDDVDSESLSSCTAAIILADLDEPLMANMTESRLNCFRELLRPDMTVLWVTLNARSENPHHAASFGFTRTIAAEIPNLKIQVLDLELLDGAKQIVLETFVRLLTPGADDENLLYVREPEIHIENGRRLVPRVLPLQSFNDRVNALRRVISSPVNTLEECMEIIPSQETDHSIRYEARASSFDFQQEPQQDRVTIQVHYSTAEAVNLASHETLHICLGTNLATNETTVALSRVNASYIEVPLSQTHPLPDGLVNELQFVEVLTRFVAAFSILNQAKGDVVLIEPDELLAQCSKHVASIKSRRVTSYFTSATKQGASCFVLHPHVSERVLRKMFNDSATTICDFLPDGAELSERIRDCVPRSCQYHPRKDLISSHATGGSFAPRETGSIWSDALSMTIQKFSTHPHVIQHSNVVSLPQLLATPQPKASLTIIDWPASRTIPQITKPLVQPQLFSPDKTYILIGLTRDFGQSLSRLFVSHGARHIVMASRNPNTNPRWTTDLASAHGATIAVEKLDVTDLDDVRAFKTRLDETSRMPPVGGIVNGAMVLDDRVFAHMTEDTWHRVFRPKTVGSSNLDCVFSPPSDARHTQPPLEFFVMTSSFAAIGGHPGQSNYAVANMYMNGLAAERRRRGLVGSVLNIGVIYGLGFLQREKEELYSGLEREGYPPISERDIHHMFLEAIVAGRPSHDGSNTSYEQPVDITTGLSRFRWGAPNPLHWHLDPRFSHWTVPYDDEDDDATESGGKARQQSLHDRLDGLDDADAITEAVLETFSERLETLLQLPRGAVNRDQGVAELGIDSLIAVEIRNWIFKTLGKDVAVLRILGAASVFRYDEVFTCRSF